MVKDVQWGTPVGLCHHVADRFHGHLGGDLPGAMAANPIRNNGKDRGDIVIYPQLVGGDGKAVFILAATHAGMGGGSDMQVGVGYSDHFFEKMTRGAGVSGGLRSMNR
jgi:hypothetical protein